MPCVGCLKGWPVRECAVTGRPVHRGPDHSVDCAAPLTVEQANLMALLRQGKWYVYGSEVGVARRLEQKGLVRLTDNGALENRRNRDGERWTAEIVTP